MILETALAILAAHGKEMRAQTHGHSPEELAAFERRVTRLREKQFVFRIWRA
jgi:hypothetical protein